MKKLFTILFILISASFLFAQDYQVTSTGVYSVDIPHLDIGGKTVHLVYGTNFRYYRFSVSGPAEPIENPIIPADNYGPVRTDIAVDPTDTNHIAIVYIDYVHDYNTGASYYGCFLVESNDWGNTWGTPVELDTVQLGTTLYDYQFNLPMIKFNNDGRMLVLWRTDENNTDTNAVYLSINRSPKIRVDNPDDNLREYAINLSIDNSDYSNRKLAVSYAKQDGDVLFYVRLSNDLGETLSDEILVKNEGDTFVQNENFTYVFWTGYSDISYIFNDFSHGPVIYTSYNGTDWEYGRIIDNDRYKYFAFAGHLGHFIRLYLNDNGKLEFYHCEFDFTSEFGPYQELCSDSAQIQYAASFIDVAYGQAYVDEAGGSVPVIATAWRDTRTGDEEIFYGYMIEPVIPEVENEGGIPAHFRLLQNYPNPFNPVTTIKYSIPANASVETQDFTSLCIYNILGEEVATLVNEKQSPGNYSVQFDASNLPSGTYFYTLRVGDFTATKKMILLK